MVRATATGMGVAGNVQVKGTDDLQASATNLPGYPVNGSVTRLFYNQEWGTLTHFFTLSNNLYPPDVFICMHSVYVTVVCKHSAIYRTAE
jgi:hypothetical protein